jgi:hypothetical protein
VKYMNDIWFHLNQFSSAVFQLTCSTKRIKLLNNLPLLDKTIQDCFYVWALCGLESVRGDCIPALDLSKKYSALCHRHVKSKWRAKRDMSSGKYLSHGNYCIVWAMSLRVKISFCVMQWRNDWCKPCFYSCIEHFSTSPTKKHNEIAELQFIDT